MIDLGDAGTRSTNQFLATFYWRALRLLSATIEHNEAKAESIGDVSGVNKPCVPHLGIVSLTL
jgi:hypothetical protein